MQASAFEWIVTLFISRRSRAFVGLLSLCRSRARIQQHMLSIVLCLILA